MTRLIGVWRSWTLLRQLVVGVSAVVMVMLVTVVTIAVLSLRSSVLGIIDGQLSGSADGFSQSVTKYRTYPDSSGKIPPPGAMKPLTHLTGQAPGNVIALIRDGKVVDSAYFIDGEARPAPKDATAKIDEINWAGTQPRTVELPELGYYRMVARPGEGNELLVTGASRKPAWQALDRACAVDHRPVLNCDSSVRTSPTRSCRRDRGGSGDPTAESRPVRDHASRARERHRSTHRSGPRR
jgi:two-component system sensor histidine kinase TrcS